MHKIIRVDEANKHDIPCQSHWINPKNPLLTEECNPAKIQNRQTQNQTKSSHSTKFCIHNILVLTIQFKHLLTCHITRFNEGKILLLLLSSIPCLRDYIRIRLCGNKVRLTMWDKGQTWTAKE